jgi:hypothetical protein
MSHHAILPTCQLLFHCCKSRSPRSCRCQTAATTDGRRIVDHACWLQCRQVRRAVLSLWSRDTNAVLHYAVWLNFNMALLAKASTDKPKASHHRKSNACSQGHSAAKIESQFNSRKSSTPDEKRSLHTLQSARYSPAQVLPFAASQDEEQLVVATAKARSTVIVVMSNI